MVNKINKSTNQQINKSTKSTKSTIYHFNCVVYENNNILISYR